MPKSDPDDTKKETVICRECNGEFTMGVDAFFCPRLPNRKIAHRPYGDVICLTCCKDKFFKTCIDINSKGSTCGTCYDCDFPIGAVMFVTEYWLEDIPRRKFVMPMESTNPDTKEKETFYSLHMYPEAFFDCPAFKWDDDKKALEIIGKRITQSTIEFMVLVTGKLPTRKVFTMDNALTPMHPLYWHELTRYYWPEMDAPQYLGDENWMDKAPVFIGHVMVNNKGEPVLDGEEKATIQDFVNKEVKRDET